MPPCWLLLILMFSLPVGGSVAAQPELPSSLKIKVYADGTEIPAKNSGITIPYSAREVRFVIGQPPLPHSTKSDRIRYQLEGFDNTWKERSSDMNVSVCFYDRAGNQVERFAYPVSGSSPGWKEAIESSTFTSRRESLVVPAGADRMGLTISSAGDAALVGIYLVKDILATRSSGNDQKPAVLLDSATFLNGEGTNVDERAAWTRDGDHPAMAQLLTLSAPKKGSQAFCIIDDDILSHADWHTERAGNPHVTPGEKLTVQWNEIYNNGMGNQSIAVYYRLPIGKYLFKVESVDAWGRAGHARNSIAVTVPKPYWQSYGFWTVCVAVLAALVALICHLWVQDRLRRHLHRVQLVEQERMRIARDLHDDLGARLAHLSLVSSYAEDSAPTSGTRSSFNEISSISRELVSALSQTVWLVNSDNNTLDSLVDFLDKLIHTLCSPNLLRCRIDAPISMEHRPVSSDLRHNVSLAVKEAVSNALKHSGGDELRALIRFETPILKVCISDNGKGFSQEQIKKGNGLANMRQRMAAVHGKVTVDSRENEGTRISFEVPIP